ncbi:MULTISPECIES: hypothetical protein [unclassified Microbacterium]|uniref:hypothetical protein n=1 Tax=unclassified Microbacterium TaxID=2609290 RepID=UPI001ACB82A1|nr:hypothetical protein [Microbacterium sp.]MBN9157281.1 response regulator transcription factor [Microbacterium sp.]MBS1896465.1 response regulator transcription factor [Actinomycetota bacterium]
MRAAGGLRRRAAIIEAHVLQRLRTADLLRHECGLDVVLTADSMLSLMTWMRGRERSEWPHLLLVDLLDPSGSDRDRAAVTALREAGMRVLLVSALRPRLAARRILDTGIDGVASKSDDERVLAATVLATLAGDRPVTKNAAGAMQPLPGSPHLSRQETKALELYATGQPIDLVAEQIGVRPDTARKYLSRVKQKYAAVGRPARSRLDLARRAWEDGISG